MDSTPASKVGFGTFSEESIKEAEDGSYYITENPFVEGLEGYDDYQYSVLENILGRMKDAFLSNDYSNFVIPEIEDASSWIESNSEIQ